MKSGRMLPVAAFLLITAGVAAFDFGFTVENATTGIWAPDFALSQKDKVSLWIDVGSGAPFSLAAQGSYSFSLDIPVLLDLDFLYLSLDLAMARVDVGRILLADFSGYVLSHRTDGVEATATLPWISVSAAAGYTGLLLKPTSTMLVSAGDLNDLADPEAKTASPRLIEAINIGMPEILRRQSLRVSVVAQQDLRADVIPEGQTDLELGGGGAVDTQYFGLGIDGPFFPAFYYEAFGYLGLGSQLTWDGSRYERRDILSYLTGVELRLFAERLLESRLSFRALLAGGDGDYATAYDGNTAGDATAFFPLSRSAVGLIFIPDLSNVSFAEISASSRPFSGLRSEALRNFQISAGIVGWFRPTTGPVAESGLDPASTARYLGAEADAVIAFRPFSDFGASLSFGWFFPNTSVGGAFLPADRDAEFLARAEASFSF